MTGLGGKWTAVAAAAALGIGLGAQVASAEILPGNGKANSNCYAAIDIDTTSATVTDEKKATEYSCVDGSACDLDGACNGSCTFGLEVCINVPDLAECTPPGMLDSVKAKGHVTGVKGASGKVVVDVPQLLEGSTCGAFVQIDVPLKSTKKGDKLNKAKLKVDAKAPKGTKPRKDKDKYDLICEPNPNGCGSASGAFLD